MPKLLNQPMRISLILSIICFHSALFAQTNSTYKKMTDTAFQAGDKILAPVIFFSLSGSSWNYPYFKDSVDKIANFIHKYPHLTIEIGSHTDSRGNKKTNLKLSYYRAAHIADYLATIQHIDAGRVKSKGYGMDFPIIPEDEIKACKTLEEKEKLYSINRRIEIKILSTD